MSRPIPPYCSGIVTPSMPCVPASCHTSRDTSPAASHSSCIGFTRSRKKVRTESRKASWSASNRSRVPSASRLST